LLNEFLKEHGEAEEQEHKLAAQDSRSQQNAADRSANLLPRSSEKKLSIHAAA
jgi:hypothetical protein